jgi:hypothetical protein
MEGVLVFRINTKSKDSDSIKEKLLLGHPNKTVLASYLPTWTERECEKLSS